MRNKMINGIKIQIQILILIKQIVEEINHHKQNAQLSPIKTLAGLMLKNKKANKIAIAIPRMVVAK